MASPIDNIQPNMLLPPRGGTFKDREELISYVRDFGVFQGYVVTIQKSKKDKDVVLGCDRGGYQRNRSKAGELKRKRKEPSRLINCPFEVYGKKDLDEDFWTLRVKNAQHNHEPLTDMTEHRFSRRFNEDDFKIIKEMSEAGAKPVDVLKTLKENNPQLKSTPRHIYNLKQKLRAGTLSEKSFKSWRPDPSAVVERILELAPGDRIRQMKISNFIGGKFVESLGSVLVNVVNPATQEIVSQVPSTTYEEITDAIISAKQAFISWKKKSVSVRQRIIFKLLDLIRRDLDELALCTISELGKTKKAALSDILAALEVVEHACGSMALQAGDFAPNTAKGFDMYSVMEPLGVCAGVCYPDFPATFPLWMFSVAILCGNTYVLKPSEINAGASMKLAALTVEAGLPDGVLNIIHGGNDAIELLCEAYDTQAISFVGSYIGGMDVYAKAASRGKRVQVNMGFKDHSVVMPDACIDPTLDAIVASAFVGGGDRCRSLSTVIFVGNSTPWEEELITRTKSLKVNGGTDATADVGPVANQQVKERICSLVQAAVESGASVILDGRDIMVPRYELGNFIGPTILSGITTSMECYQECISGPVLLCLQVDNLEEAITIINQQRFGNRASIFTTSGVSARKFQNKVNAGLVGVNVSVPVPLPFSSTESMSSSTGDLNLCGKAGIQFYTQVKMVAQQWKDLPAGGSMTFSNRQATKRAVSVTKPSSSSAAFSTGETSSSVPPPSVREMTNLERPQNNNNGTLNQDTSTALLTGSGFLPNQETPQALMSSQALTTASPGMAGVPNDRERNCISLNAQTYQDMTPESTACFEVPETSERHDLGPAPVNGDLESQWNVEITPSDHARDGKSSSDQVAKVSAERSYMPIHQGLDGTVLDMHCDRGLMSTTFQQSNDVCQGNGAILQHSSDGAYNLMTSEMQTSISPGQGDDAIEAAASVMMFLPETSSQSGNAGVGSLSEKIYLPNFQSENDRLPTEGLYMPSSSQTYFNQGNSST